MKKSHLKNYFMKCQKLLNVEIGKNLGNMINLQMNRIIPYVITWESILSKYHSKHKKEHGITDRIKAYIYISMDFSRPANNCFPRADTR
ncbi:hypothetical protein NAPIS_ORF00776 [Vairimorpha apis BRL 01]|uniref:Uncharacterized protein n=1 Tax=Vairimorpha apis BRL 01 TaxID=1037528 RepID=T0LBI2_9MICR|nr:hypothetical protein NAPIS_ORF00776 [Vairimorpha apis BRL 01]